MFINRDNAYLPGSFKDWKFENIYVESGPGKTTSRILGGQSRNQMDDIYFINLQYGNNPPYILTKWDPNYFDYTQDFPGHEKVGNIYFCNPPTGVPCPSPTNDLPTKMVSFASSKFCFLSPFTVIPLSL